ncbi:DNA invertase Pin-like site-specific DNA recombinase [Neobacillus niacini]|nr:DNA invertase Pin-like site-specific DNA recombinase [Neobacillus niacini]
MYTDKKSQTKGNHPGLKALIEDGKAGLHDVILAKELSRFARNGRLSYEFTKQKGLSIVLENKKTPHWMNGVPM